MRIPAEWQPDPGASYNEVVAEIRHAYTDYEDLLHSLPLCIDEMEAGRCTWDPEQESWCSIKDEAHNLLKWAAKGVAIRLYKEYQERKTGTDDTRQATA